MRRSARLWIIGIAVTLLAGQVCAAQDDEVEPRSYGASSTNTGPISAPVMYKDTMLIVVNSNAVAAIVFGDRPKIGTKGITYRFRYLEKEWATEHEGEGEVYEERKNGEYAGGKLTIRAGNFRIGWSSRSDDSGWVYYDPELLRIQIASADRFETELFPNPALPNPKEKLDLRRFFELP